MSVVHPQAATNFYSTWTREYAIDACHVLEQALAPLGMHVALTGGCLYKEGPRKDLDVILYRHAGMELAPFADLRPALSAIGIRVTSIHRNVIKCQWADDTEVWQLDLILRAAVSWPETEACPEGSSDAQGYFKQGSLLPTALEEMARAQNEANNAGDDL